MTGENRNNTDPGPGEDDRHDDYEPFPVWESARQRRVTSSDGTTLHVDETGNEGGQPVLFIHGAYQSRLVWEKQILDGLTDCRLVAMDLRGHGLSDEPTGENGYTADRWADDVHTVIDSLDLTNPVLVGWSFGGWVINDYISQYGCDRIASINLVSTSGGASVDGRETGLSERRDETATYRENVETLNDFVHSLFYEDVTPRDHYYFLGFNLLTALGAVSRTANHTDMLGDIDVPTLISHGEEDPIVSNEQAETLAENISNAQLSYYENVGHVPFWEAPERFNRELRSLIDSR